MNTIYEVNYIERKNYKKYFFTDEQKDLIKKLYNENNSTVNIGKLFNVSHKTIAKILGELNIQRTGISRRHYTLNEFYFDNIDDQNKAYILGLLYADGCNFIKKGTVSMSLEEDDRKILEKIRTKVDSERELEFIDYSNKHDGGYTYKNQYRLLFFSTHMCNSLNSHGMTPNKSLSLKFPVIEPDLVRHFIRGYFDGDGSVYQGKRKTQFVLTITSTNGFCKTLKEIIEDELGVNCHIYDASNHNGITKVLSTSGRVQVKKLLDWLYKDAELFLERKYNRYIQYFYEHNNDINNSLSA